MAGGGYPSNGHGSSPRMTDVVNSEIPRAEYLFPNQNDRNDLRRHAKQHRRNISQLKRAVESGSPPRIRRCAAHICGSFSSRLVAAIASARHKQGASALSLAAMKARAASLDAFGPNPERIRCIVLKKSGGRIRTICAPGLQRRALDWLCAEILDICLPVFAFDFMQAGHGGVDAPWPRPWLHLPNASRMRRRACGPPRRAAVGSPSRMD